LVNTVTNSAFMGATVPTTISLIGPLATVTVAAGQKVIVMVSGALGSTAVGGANSLNIYPGYRTSPGGVVNTSGAGIFGLTCAQGQRHIYSVDGVITDLPPGTYDFGMAVISTNGANWNNNEYGYVTVIVTN
jgi:hypothetical protein